MGRVAEAGAAERAGHSIRTQDPLSQPSEGLDGLVEARGAADGLHETVRRGATAEGTTDREAHLGYPSVR
jgi:hypothetical protein